MNKTALTIGGVAVTSLAAGVAGGYFVAKKKFDDQLDQLIAVEVRKTKQYYLDLLEKNKAEPKKDIPEQETAEDRDEAEEEEPELSDQDLAVMARGREKIANAAAALTNYQGYSDKPSLKDVVEHRNIFTDGTPKKVLPPKDKRTGRFVRSPKHSVEEESQSETKKPVDDPFLIEEDDFLVNDSENEQESVLYFANDKTAVMVSDYNNEVPIGRIGEANLTLFPNEEPSVIYVRNTGLGMDYQITRTYQSLTQAMGMGEEDLPDDDEYNEG